MKKMLMLLFLLSFTYCLQIFGYYKDDNFIDFLVHSNQLRIRTDRLGVLFGNKNIRAVVGVTGSQNASGIIINNLGQDVSLSDSMKGIDKLVPAVLAGIGYDTDVFGIGVAYEYKWNSPTYMVHIPILTMTAMNDNFRINIPVSIGIGNRSKNNVEKSLKGTTVVSTAIEGRYYFNAPYFSHIRLYFNYGNATINEVNNPKINFNQQSIGVQARAYFRYEFPYNMIIEPIIRVQFDQSLKTKLNNVENDVSIVDNYFITAKGLIPEDLGGTGNIVGSGGANADLNIGNLKGGYIASIPIGYYAKEPYRLGVAIPIGFRATSADKNIEFYLEPSLSFTLINAKDIYIFGTENFPEESRKKRKNPFYTFGYVVYGELYIRPIPQLEWYTELQTGGATVAGELASGQPTTIIFNGATGITWYF